MKLPEGTLGPDDVGGISAGYREEYRRLYGREGPDVPLEAITWRVEVSAPRPEILQEERGGDPRALDEARKGRGRSTSPKRTVLRPSPSTTATASTPARPSTALPSSKSGNRR